jgi:putative spermidine/putrescine transport system permease protein
MTGQGQMQIRWGLFLIGPVIASLLLFVIPQVAFLQGSFFGNLGYGQISTDLTADNYLQFFTDGFYFRSLLLTIGLSVLTVIFTVGLGLPAAYGLARWRSPWRSFWVTLLVASALITVVIKALGLMVLLSTNGPINKFIMWVGLTDMPVQLLNNNTGATIGLVHYTLPLVVLVLFSVIQTIPASLEEAARTLGGSEWTGIRRVVLPLAVPGIIASGLMSFNLSMGTFTSTALLGGGKVMTVPILIQRKAIFEVNYPFAAASSVILLLSALLINVLVFELGRRFQKHQVGK